MRKMTGTLACGLLVLAGLCMAKSASGAGEAKMAAGESTAYTHVFSGVMRFMGGGESGSVDGTEKLFRDNWMELFAQMSNFRFEDIRAIKGDVSEHVLFSPVDALYGDRSYWTRRGGNPAALRPGRRYVVAVRLADPEATLTDLRKAAWERLDVFGVDETVADLADQARLAGGSLIVDGRRIAERRGGAWHFAVEDFRNVLRGLRQDVADEKTTYAEWLTKFGRPLVVWGDGDDCVAAYAFVPGLALDADDRESGGSRESDRFDHPSHVLVLVHARDGKAVALRAVRRELAVPASRP